MREFIPKTYEGRCSRPHHRSSAGRAAAVSLLCLAAPLGCRAPLSEHHVRTNAPSPRAGHGESRQEAEPAQPSAGPAEEYLSSEVGALMREDQKRSREAMTSRAPHPPPRRPEDAPLRPARRPGKRPFGP